MSRLKWIWSSVKRPLRKVVRTAGLPVSAIAAILLLQEASKRYQWFPEERKPDSGAPQETQVLKPSWFDTDRSRLRSLGVPTIADLRRAERNLAESVVVDYPPVGPRPALCEGVEYAGRHPGSWVLERDAWLRVVRIFLDAKGDLRDWLYRNRGHFDDLSFELMARRLRKTEIEPPPYRNEPDLAWRGIASLARKSSDGPYDNSYDRPLVRVGVGFLTLAHRDARRARFELARVIAQAWSPCELRKFAVRNIWEPVLECVDVEDDSGCRLGGDTEEGWAVSTSVARAVFHPGCRIPAFESASVRTCLRDVGLGWKDAGGARW